MAARIVAARSSPLLPSLLRRVAQTPSRQSFQTCSRAPTARVFSSPQSIRFLSDTTKDGTNPSTEAPKDDAAAPVEESPEAEPQVDENKEEQLEAQVKELKDHLLRCLAEQDNTRRIAAKDVESARQFAIKNFAKSLLDVSDNLTRALDSVPKDVLADKERNPVLAALYEGIELTETGLNKAFEMNGLVKYGEAGDKFDPNQHEALMQYPDPSKDNGVIGQVMKKGFLLNKRVLRPAEVGIVKNA
jgi:molecular chaperone GrpE